MLAFGLKTDTFEKLYKQASGWTSNVTFVEKLNIYKLGIKNQAQISLKSFEDIGNTVLQVAMDDHNIPDERRVRLASAVDLNVIVNRKPDIAIVPQCSSHSDLIRGDKFDWRRTLGALQVLLPVAARVNKRKSDEDLSETQAPPSKRSKTISTEDVAPAISVVVDAKAQVEEDGDDNLSDTSTDLDVDSVCDNSSILSSNATLYRNNLEGELAGVCADIFASEGDRTFSIGACVYGARLKLMLCSHSGVIESDECDFSSEPQLFALFLFMFATSSLSDLGFNSKIGYHNPFDTDDSETLRVNIDFQSFTSDNNQTEQPSLHSMKLGQKIVAQSGLVSRGTAVYRLEHTDSEYSPPLVIKYSWQVKSDRHEDDVIRSAREVDPVHIPELFGTAVVDDCSPLELLRNACLQKSKQHEPRELRVMVMREYVPLVKLGFGDEFWDVFVQLLGCELIVLFQLSIALTVLLQVYMNCIRRRRFYTTISACKISRSTGTKHRIP